jgi:hypothetical protein
MIAAGMQIGARLWVLVSFPLLFHCRAITDITIGNLLLKRLLESIHEAKRTRKEFNNFNECLREEDENLVVQWEAELLAWTEDNSQLDPYRIPASSESHVFNPTNVY